MEDQAGGEAFMSLPRESNFHRQPLLGQLKGGRCEVKRRKRKEAFAGNWVKSGIRKAQKNEAGTIHVQGAVLPELLHKGKFRFGCKLVDRVLI
jgi:hypothetical protein